MGVLKNDDLLIEGAAHQLLPSPLHRFRINRRRFFKLLGGGIAVTVTAGHVVAHGLMDEGPADDSQVNAWIHIGENDRVTVYTGKVEVGQNIRTSLSQAVAEELRVPVGAIDMVMADTDLTPYDRGTFGSLTTPHMAPRLRQAAATAREMLTDMAAAAWKTDRGSLQVADGKVVDTRTKQSLRFGQLTKGKALIKNVNEQAALTPVQQWKTSGVSVPKVDGNLYVTGRHRYVSDMTLPGMLHGRVLRPSAFGATLDQLDVSKAAALPGVVVATDGDFVGVAAPDAMTAEKALTLIKATWKTTPQPSRATIFDYLVTNSRSGGEGRRGSHAAGNVAEGLKNATVTSDQTFYIDYIAHAPLEPRAALAEWKDNKLTVWTGTQRPFGVQEELSHAFGVAKENVRVIVPDTGSGYGGKHTGDAALEAARLAREAKRPVKIVWTREEEFTWAYFRPGGVITVKAGARPDGTVTAWEFHNYNSGGSGIGTPYEVANQEIKYHPVESPLRQGSYRGLAATANVFARECIMTDLADELKTDPLDFRLKNLQDERLIAVLKAAAEKFGWRSRKSVKGTGYGLACGAEKGSFIATCAEVAVNGSGAVTVKRVVAAFECGAIVNPSHLENQIEGSVVQGLGGALFEWIDFKDGKILNPRFSAYRVPRFKDIPVIDVVMLDRKDLPSVGAGETPIMGIAPAIRNAIADATGKRLYTLPLVPEGLGA